MSALCRIWTGNCACVFVDVLRKYKADRLPCLMAKIEGDLEDIVYYHREMNKNNAPLFEIEY